MKTERKKKSLLSMFVTLSILNLLIFVGNPESTTAASQVPDFYYYYTEKIPLNQSTEMITICFEESVSEGEKEALIRDDPVLKDVFDETLPSGLVLAVAKEGLGKIGKKKALKNVRKRSKIFENIRKVV